MKETADMRSVIGLVLRFGVVAAFALVALGSALLLVEGKTGYYPLGAPSQLYGERFYLGPSSLLQGIASAKPYAIIDLGLTVLLATPVARVAISVLLFVEERSYAFVAITATVLAILLVSVFVVAPLVSA